MAQPKVRYLFGSLDSGDIIAELPLQSVTMNKKLNDWGTFRGTVYFDTSGVDNADLAAATIPGRCFVVAERDNVPIWDGIVWTSTYDSQAKVMNMTARTYEAYAEKQLIDVDFIRAGTDQRQIFCDLWRQMQSTSVRNIRIDVPSTVFDNQVPRNISVLASEYKTYMSAMSSMSDGDDGFDYTIVTTRSNNKYFRSLQIGYPYLGIQDVTASPLSFDYPGNILNYYEAMNISNAGTNLFLLGAGEGTDMAVGTAIQADLLSTGFKRYDVVVSRKDVENQNTLDSLAQQLGTLRRPPLSIVKVFLKGNLEPEFGSYGLGDTAMVGILDAKHPNGFQSAARIVAWEYTPPSDDSVEQAEIIFYGDELNDE